jgi:hypothetical protein
MNPLQLRETTMAPDTRRLVQLTAEDAMTTCSTWTCCWPKNGPPTAAVDRGRAAWGSRIQGKTCVHPHPKINVVGPFLRSRRVWAPIRFAEALIFHPEKIYYQVKERFP